MTSEIPTISSIISQLPQNLQRRFDSLGKYVRGIVDEESSKTDTRVILSTEEIQLIQLAALVYSLDSFFRAGTRSARNAATIFEQYELPGFQVGSTVFTKDNYNTRRGDLLAENLQEAILGTNLGKVIKNSSSMRGLISTMIREMNNG
jgi:hypothetical protein